MSNTIKIDWEKVGRLLEFHCSGVEIAGQLGINENTLYNHCKIDLDKDFVAFKAEKRASGKALLRIKQFEAALKDKNVTMQIWLGKQFLEQKDKSEVEQTIKREYTDIEIDEQIKKLTRELKNADDLRNKK